jgi:hypothetical protein
MTDPQASVPFGNPKKQPAFPPGPKVPIGLKKGPGSPLPIPPKRSISMLNGGAAKAAIATVDTKPLANVRLQQFFTFPSPHS